MDLLLHPPDMLGLQPKVRSDQLAGIPNTTIPHAVQACAACRKQKRKCDKLLPACSRCSSLRRMCDYAESAAVAAAPSAEAFAALQMKLVEIEARLNGNNNNDNSNNANSSNSSGSVQNLTPAGSGTNVGGGGSDPSPDDILTGNSWPPGYEPGPAVGNHFPRALFLDIDIYRYVGMTPPKPVVTIPMEVIEILDSSEVIEQTASVYFQTTHKWFSFISRKRMNLGISLADGGPDLALLFLAMRLITTPPPPEPDSAAELPLYRTTKHFTALLEAAGTTSIMHLQAMIIVTLYEYSHAIYPAAWMSVGACVRYAAMLGLPSYGEATSVLGPCTTWTETEERRRVWWATYILDRVVSLGSKRPFAGGDDAPPGAEGLPVDDDAWDAGDLSWSLRPRPAAADVGAPGAGGPFTRLAQAAVLVSKAMAHCRRAAARYDEGGNGNGRSDSGRKDNGKKHGKSGGDRNKGDNDGTGRDTTGDNDVDMNNDDDDDDDDDAAAANDPARLNIREVTALVTEQSAFCRAVGADMAAASATGGVDGAYFGYLAARCLSWSTNIMVLDLYACPEHMRPGAGVTDGVNAGGNARLAMQGEAIAGLARAGAMVGDVALEVLGVLGREDDDNGGKRRWQGEEEEGEEGEEGLSSVSVWGPKVSPPVVGEEGVISMVDRFSPLCLDTLYCGMSTFHWLWRENGDPQMKEGLNITRRCLERLQGRWRLAGEFLEIEKRHDVGAMMADCVGSNGAE